MILEHIPCVSRDNKSILLIIYPDNMKLSALNLAYVVLCCFLATGCTTSELVEQEEPQPVVKEEIKGQEITLNFEIMHNSFTRAEDSEEKIDNLYLAFYNVSEATPQFIKLVEASSLSGNSKEFTTTFDLTEDVIPNAVVAYANICDATILENALTSKPTSNKLVNDNNSYIMTSARYYDTSNGNTDVFYSKIEDSNINNGNPVGIYLERIAAKVTVTNAMENTATIGAFDNSGKARKINLELTGWNVSGTDQSTYLLKNNGDATFAIMRDELGENNSSNWEWNNVSNHSLNWAHSVNWDETSFPTPGSESASAKVNYLTFSQINNNLGESALFHETTRSASMYNTKNARPSVILAGQYTIQGETTQTLYRNGSIILTEDELLEYFASKNTKNAPIYTGSGFSYGLMYKSSELGYLTGVVYNAKKIKDCLGVVFDIKTPNYISNNTGTSPVTLQVILTKPNADYLSYGSSEVPFEAFEDINKNLIELMGLWEVYDGGRCFFHIPIEHTGKSADSDVTKTGSYGLVRNHHYNITINSIEGMGIGVPSSNTYLGEWEYPSNPEVTKDVKYNISINDWNQVKQDVNIEKK